MMRQMMEHAGLKTGLIGTIEAIIGDEHIPAVNTTPESFLVQGISGAWWTRVSAMW